MNNICLTDLRITLTELGGSDFAFTSIGTLTTAPKVGFQEGHIEPIIG